MHQHLLDDVARTAALLDARGWAESSAGNISVMYDGPAPGIAMPDGLVHLGQPLVELAGRHMLITGSGTRMRDTAADPASCLAVMHIAADGTTAAQYCAVEGQHSRPPSSEFHTHAAVHAFLARNGRDESCIVHTHATEIAAITHHEDFLNEDALNHLVWSMQPEAALFIPEGLGLVPYMISGTATIGEATVEALAARSVVVWEKHGILAVGRTCEAAFDLIDVVAKSIRIYLLCKSAGFVPEGLSKADIDALRKRAAG
ncbi:MAG: rhamnulose-1-phosphate aldolase [Ignavibacteriae bacterium]|nr:rhamnulose-1-phosphate aldolase [Ignavibacteriota bacterium]